MGSFGLFQMSAWMALAGGAVFGVFQWREGRTERADVSRIRARSKSDD
jgi:hypothetical protein